MSFKFATTSPSFGRQVGGRLLLNKGIPGPVQSLPWLKLHFTNPPSNKKTHERTLILHCSDSSSTTPTATNATPPPVLRKRSRYRKQYPGESKGITEEMRFVAMKLRNNKAEELAGGTLTDSKYNSSSDEQHDIRDSDVQTWQPSIEGFLKFLVDSHLIFATLDRIVEQSTDVSYAYFRRTGLERSEGLLKDIEWFRQQDIVIPEPSMPGITYAKYLEEIAEKSAPLFLSHFYNIYFSHIAGGQVIAKQVSAKILEERELEFYQWEGDAAELLKGVREKLNMLGEHWTRDEKNRCLKETTKSFRFLGQIVRLIILL